MQEIEVQTENIEKKSDSIEDKIIKELKAIVSTKDAESIPIVEDQLPKEVLQPQVDIIDPVKVQKYLKKKKPKKKSVVAKDKKKRIQYTVKIPLVKNHLSKRATKYSSMVKKQASRFNLDPSLVMAIIHVTVLIFCITQQTLK